MFVSAMLSGAKVVYSTIPVASGSKPQTAKYISLSP